MLRTVLLLNIFREILILFFQDSLMSRTAFKIEIFCFIIKVFTVTLDQFNVALLIKSFF